MIFLHPEEIRVHRRAMQPDFLDYQQGQQCRSDKAYEE
jgi:hypothetical protein